MEGEREKDEMKGGGEKRRRSKSGIDREHCTSQKSTSTV